MSFEVYLSRIWLHIITLAAAQYVLIVTPWRTTVSLSFDRPSSCHKLEPGGSGKGDERAHVTPLGKRTALGPLAPFYTGLQLPPEIISSFPQVS